MRKVKNVFKAYGRGMAEFFEAVPLAIQGLPYFLVLIGLALILVVPYCIIGAGLPLISIILLWDFGYHLHAVPLSPGDNGYVYIVVSVLTSLPCIYALGRAIDTYIELLTPVTRFLGKWKFFNHCVNMLVEFGWLRMLTKFSDIFGG